MHRRPLFWNDKVIDKEGKVHDLLSSGGGSGGIVDKSNEVTLNIQAPFTYRGTIVSYLVSNGVASLTISVATAASRAVSDRTIAELPDDIYDSKYDFKIKGKASSETTGVSDLDFEIRSENGKAIVTLSGSCEGGEIYNLRTIFFVGGN